MPVPSAMLTVALLSKDVALMSNNGESSAHKTRRRGVRDIIQRLIIRFPCNR